MGTVRALVDRIFIFASVLLVVSLPKAHAYLNIRSLTKLTRVTLACTLELDSCLMNERRVSNSFTPRSILLSLGRIEVAHHS